MSIALTDSARYSAAETARRQVFQRRVAAVLLALLAGGVTSCTAPSGPAASASSGVRLISDAVVPSSPELASYRIETDSATYYLEKTGAGLAAMIDRDGNDWIGFRSEPGSRSSGEFRGFPNAVHQQAGNYFHPKNQNTDPSVTEIEYEGLDRVTISATSGNGLWAGRYDFFPTHCTFTMTRMPADYKYWVLYEGTPGGGYDDTDWWITSAVGEPQPLTTNHEGDIPGPEWIAFGDTNVERVLYLVHHEDDEHPDRYYQMGREMTVFGFGRLRGEKFLDSVPQHFSIGLLETRDPAEIAQHLEEFVNQGLEPPPPALSR